MLQVTFLGTSGSTPTTERGMPAIAVKYESELMLWDCGEGTQRQLMRYKVGYGSINSVFITHPHLDHYLGLFGLLETLKLSVCPKPLPIFFPGFGRLARNLTRNLSRNADRASHASPGDPSDDRFARYQFAQPDRIHKGILLKGHAGAGFTITAFPVKHCKDSYGLIFEEADRIKFHEEKAHGLGLQGRLFKEIQKKGKVKLPNGNEVRLEDVSWVKPGRKIVYTGDCMATCTAIVGQAAGSAGSGLDTNILMAAKDADLLIHEATFDAARKEEAAERMHSTSEDAAIVAKAAGAKRLVITHLSPRYSDKVDAAALLEQARSIFPNTELAYDGMAVEL